MKRRLFIAINLPEAVKNKVEKEIEKFRYDFVSDIRFLDRDNWHITVTFLGYQEDESIGPTLESMQKIAGDYEPFDIKLTDISYGPKGKTPRMIWLNGAPETSAAIEKLKNDLEGELVSRRVQFKREHRRLSIHITLARLHSAKDLPEIQRNLSLAFEAKSLDLMESSLPRAGAKYENLQEVDFRLK